MPSAWAIHATQLCLPAVTSCMHQIFMACLHAQPLRESLRIHARFRGIAGIAGSLALPSAADAPGPLEAGHRRARSLILTPTEVKKARQRGGGRRPPRRPSLAPVMKSLTASGVMRAAEQDLMVFSPDAPGSSRPGAADACTGRRSCV